MKITIDLNEEQEEQLRKVAGSLGIDPAELAKATLADQLSQPAEDFQKSAEYVLKKNRVLYQRLS